MIDKFMKEAEREQALRVLREYVTSSEPLSSEYLSRQLARVTKRDLLHMAIEIHRAAADTKVQLTMSLPGPQSEFGYSVYKPSKEIFLSAYARDNLEILRDQETVATWSADERHWKDNRGETWRSLLIKGAKP